MMKRKFKCLCSNDMFSFDSVSLSNSSPYASIYVIRFHESYPLDGVYASVRPCGTCDFDQYVKKYGFEIIWIVANSNGFDASFHSFLTIERVPYRRTKHKLHPSHSLFAFSLKFY